MSHFTCNLFLPMKHGSTLLILNDHNQNPTDALVPIKNHTVRGRSYMMSATETATESHVKSDKRQAISDLWQVTCDVMHVTCDKTHVTSDKTHVTSDKWNMACDTWHVTCDKWQVTSEMWHVTHDTWHVTSYKWNVTCDIWHVTCDMWHVTSDKLQRDVQWNWTSWTPLLYRKGYILQYLQLLKTTAEVG